MPAARPVITPVRASAVAVVGVTAVQVPPGVADSNVVLLPSHTDVVPVIGSGTAFTVTVVTAADMPQLPVRL